MKMLDFLKKKMMAGRMPTVRALFIENGVIQPLAVLDLGDSLALKRGDKWLAWAKGRPLLSKMKDTDGYTFIIAPEIAWTLDSQALVNILRNGKSVYLKQVVEKIVRLSDQDAASVTIPEDKQVDEATQTDKEKAAGDISPILLTPPIITAPDKPPTPDIPKDIPKTPLEKALQTDIKEVLNNASIRQTPPIYIQ